MRKLGLIALAAAAVLALAACGGGGSSSSGQTVTPSEEVPTEEPAKSASAEGAWAEEVTAVISEFENKVTPRVIEPIHTSTAQEHLEPLYATYSIDLKVLAKKLEATKAPAECVATRKKMADITSEVSVLTKTLSGDSKLNPEQYAAKGYNQGLKIDKLGHALGALTAKPHC